MPDPHSHLFEVEVRVGSVSGAVELVMPSWTPGSYLMREFGRHVQDFAATDASGSPLPWRKTDRSTWRVEAGAGTEVVARYRVFAHELTVRTSHLDDSHAFVNGASVFMFARGREAERVEIEVEAQESWEVATSLERQSAERAGKGSGTAVTRLFAADYDELVDSPLEIGTHKTVAWEQDGVPHEYVIWGHSDFDTGRLVSETRAIIDTAKAMFGGSLPYDRFVFILHVIPDGRGGLEHRASTSLQVPAKMTRGAEYEHLISLVAHEFFHVWNAKRIRPEPLGPFDYTRENYTRNLWVVEGITTYYTDLLLVRSGVITKERYLARLGESISRLQSLPGRRHQTLEDSSFDTWIRFYRPDEHTPNSQISYYHKGAMVALLLDMEIRRVTSGARSLDDLMLLLWERYGARDVGFPEDPRAGIEALAEEVAGVELAGFFDRYLRGTDELDFGRALEVVGLTLADGEPQEPGAPFPRPTQQERRLGLRTQQKGDRLVVSHVFADTPAAEAGVYAGDELVAVGGARATQEWLDAALQDADDGAELSLTIMRRDALRTVSVITGQALKRVRVVEAAGAMEGAAEERGRWLGRSGPESAASG